MNTVLLTCAGQSTRFPNHRAKWSLTHPTGHTMAAASLLGLHLSPQHQPPRIIAAFNQRDAGLYGLETIRKEFAKSQLIVEPVCVGETRSQVETVLAALREANVHDTDPVIVRDCDNYFAWEPNFTNEVAVVDLNDVDTPLVVKNKSFVRMAGGKVACLDEKRVTSPLFCCGAYSFRYATILHENTRHGEQFLSEVVHHAVLNGESFGVNHVTSYEDWGTEQDWLNYVRSYRTLFVDIDGVLVKSSHRTFEPAWGTTRTIDENIAALNRLRATGRVEVILTTSRPEELRAVTEDQLKELKYDRLIMGLRNCSRVIVNDAVGKRGQLTALAVNLERESPALGEMLSSLP